MTSPTLLDHRHAGGRDARRAGLAQQLGRRLRWIDDSVCHRWRGIRRLDPARGFGGWFHGIVRHLCLSAIRQRRPVTTPEIIERLETLQREIEAVPNVDLVAVRAFDAQGQGSYADVIKGLDWIVAHKDDYDIRARVFAPLDGVPEGIDPDAVEAWLRGRPGVASVHDLHIWSLSAERTALSAHLVVEDLSRWTQTLVAAQKMIGERFAIDHVTLQPEVRLLSDRVMEINEPGRG